MLAAAAVVSVALPASEAWALALGRVNVQSALGEPLRAEIDLPQITPAEAEALKATTASPEVFRAQVEAQPPVAADDPAKVYQGGAFCAAGPFGD